MARWTAAARNFEVLLFHHHDCSEEASTEAEADEEETGRKKRKRMGKEGDPFGFRKEKKILNESGQIATYRYNSPSTRPYSSAQHFSFSPSIFDRFFFSIIGIF